MVEIYAYLPGTESIPESTGGLIAVQEIERTFLHQLTLWTYPNLILVDSNECPARRASIAYVDPFNFGSWGCVDDPQEASMALGLRKRGSVVLGLTFQAERHQIHGATSELMAS